MLEDVEEHRNMFLGVSLLVGLDTAEDVQSLVFLSLDVQCEESDEGGDLEQEVNEESHASVESECLDSRHGGESSQEEAGRLCDGAEKHRWRHLPHHSTNLILLPNQKRVSVEIDQSEISILPPQSQSCLACLSDKSEPG